MTREQRLFGAACLKVALETAGDGAPEGEIYRGTLTDLGLTDDEVTQYLQDNRGVVIEALAKRRRRPPFS